MPVVNDIAKRFEQLETQWLRFQRKAATKRDETAASLASTPNLLSSSQERLDGIPASRGCLSNFSLPLADLGALSKPERASRYRSGGKASKERARSSLLAAPRFSSVFSEWEHPSAPSYSTLGHDQQLTPASKESKSRNAAAAQRGTVSFAGYSGRAPDPAVRNSVRTSLAHRKRTEPQTPQQRCANGRSTNRAEASQAEPFPEPSGSPVEPHSPESTYARDSPVVDNSAQRAGGYKSRRLRDAHSAVGASDRHGDIKRNLRGDVFRSTHAASDPSTYSSGKGPPRGDCRLDGRNPSTAATLSQRPEAPNSDKGENCRLGDSLEHSRRTEHGRNASPRDYHSPDDKGYGHDYEEMEVPPGNARQPLNQLEQRGRANNFFPIQEQTWTISRQKHGNGVADPALSALETGKMVVRKLLACLKDVLLQFEQKDEALQDNWQNLAHQRRLCIPRTDMEDFSADYGKYSMKLNDLSLLAQDASPENWSGPVIAICRRLVLLFGRETHLQKWAVALERETVHLFRMEDEMAEMKAISAKEAERVSALDRLVEERCTNVEEERLNLAKERETLSLWVGHLQERRKAVAECEKEAAASLAQVQKRSANLFVRESAIDGRALEIATLQEEVRIVSQRLHEDLELITKEKTKIQEKLRQVVAKEADVETQMTALTKMQQDALAQSKKLEHDRVLGDEEKTRTAALYQEMEEKLMVKENMLHALHKQVDDVKLEAEIARKLADDARASIWQDRLEADEYITSMDVRLQEWEEELKNRELELLRKEECVKDLERSVIGKQERYQVLHQKVLEEQQNMSDELNRRELTLAKRAALQDQKCAKEFEKLQAEHGDISESRQLLSEMESRICNVAKGLQAKHEELLEQVREDVKQYRERMKELETVKWSLKSESIRGLEELNAHKQALLVWQNDVEGSMEEQIKNMVNDKSELEGYVQRLNKMQCEIDSVGSQVLEHILVLEQTAVKLEDRQRNVELAHSLVKESAGKLMKQQDLLSQREASLQLKESNLLEGQNQLKQLAVEAQAHEIVLKEKEQALINGKNYIHVMEAKLEDERKSFTQRVLRFKQHVTNLEKEAANTEKTLRSQAEALSQKERNLAIEKLSLLKVVGEDRSIGEGMCTDRKNNLHFREREQQIFEVRMKSLEESGVESWQRVSHEQGTGATQEGPQSLIRANLWVEQDEHKSGYDLKTNEPKDCRPGSDLLGQYPDLSEPCMVSSGESGDAGLTQEKMMKSEVGHKVVAGTDQRGSDIKDFWQRLRTSRLRSDVDSVGAEERIESLLTSLAKTGTGVTTSDRRTRSLASEDTEDRHMLREVHTDPTRKERTNGVKDHNVKRVAFLDKHSNQEANDDQVTIRNQGREEGCKTANFLSTLSEQMAKDSNWMKQIAPRSDTNEHRVVDEEEQRKGRSLVSTNYVEGSSRAKSTGTDICRDEGMEHAEPLLGAATTHQLNSAKLERMVSNGNWSRDISVHSEVIGYKGNPIEEVSSTRTQLDGNPSTDTGEISPHGQNPRKSLVGRGFRSQESAYPGPVEASLPDVVSVNAEEAVRQDFCKFNTTCGHVPRVAHVPEVRNENLSSQQRLESAMAALQQASQRSRSRLEDARNGLRSLPASVAVASQAEAALDDLAAKLNLMEQIEEGLASQLDRASMLQQSPNTVDRVQLLTRLKEQERLRAEWEEDMHQQVESIESVLRVPSCRSSPQKVATSLNWSQLRRPSSASCNHGTPWHMLGSSGSVHRSAGSVADWACASLNSSSTCRVLDHSRPWPRRSAVGCRAGDEHLGVSEGAYVHSYHGHEFQHRMGDTPDFRSPAMSSRRKLLMSPLQKNNIYGLFNK